MKRSPLCAALLFVICCVAFSADVQAQVVDGYTSIDYDEFSNVVTAYSETTVDYDLMYDYQAYVSLSVSDQYSAVRVSGSARDFNNNGFVSVTLQFAADPDMTYTARGIHKAYTQLYSYDYDYDYYPYRQIYYYYDYWWYGFYEGQGIYSPWWRSWLNNGFREVRRRNRYIPLGTTYDYASVTTPGSLSVTMSGAQTIKDGETASFSVTASGDTPTNYEWSFRAPARVGNSPKVTFSPASGSASVTTDGHWFASPNTECGAAVNATYTIKCVVTFSNGKKKSAETTLTVSSQFDPSNRAGETDNPTIGGYPAYGFDPARNLWVVTGTGTMVRRAPNVTIHVPNTSQFYNKTVTHENKHVDQYQTGMLSDLYTVASLFAQLSPLTDATEQGLVNKINSTTLSCYSSEGVTLGNRRRAAEQEAHGVSDPIAPMYRYQWNCVSSLY